MRTLTATRAPACISRGSCAGLLGIAGLALLILAQLQFSRQRLTLWSGLALGIGSALWIGALLLASPRESLPSLTFTTQNVRRPLLILAVSLGGLAWLASGNGTYQALNVGAWIGATGAWIGAWWTGNGQTAADTGRKEARSESFVALLLLLAIVAVGAWFRFHRLSDLPGDPTSDHAEKLLDVRSLLDDERPIFFPRNTGREPAQFYFTFALIRITGLPLAFDTLKIGTAIIGVMAIPAVFLLAREIADRWTGLMAAALYAIGTWPTNTARMGLRFPYGPLPAALALWLILRYLRRGERRDALLCGLVIGFGLHGYISFRIVPLAIALVLLLAPLADRRWRRAWRRLLLDGTLLVATAIIATLPLLRYSAHHPEQVWLRVATRVSDAETATGGWREQLATFATNNVNALLAFNWRGDETMVNAVRYAPFLDPITGAALIAGLLIAVYLGMRQRAPRPLLLIATIPVLLLASTLSLAFPNENPSANRLGVIAPVIFTLAALPLGYLAQTTRAPGHANSRLRLAWRVAVGSILGGVLLTAAHQNYVNYFHEYARQYRAAVPNIREIAAAVKQQNVPLDQTYILAYPYWFDGRNLALALGDLDWQRDHDLTADDPLPDDTRRPLLFLLHPADDARRRELEAVYPDGAYRLQQSAIPGKDWAFYMVPAP